jgi:hypothetical protein
MSPRILLISAAGLVLVLGARPAQAQHTLSAYSTCASSDSLYVIWTLYDATADPTAHPEWVGYDVLRRALPGCDAYVRANDQSIPRLAGQTHTRYFGEVVPATGTLYEYRVIAVDASHQQIFLPGFCAPCDVYQSCPPFSAPVTVGTLLEEASWLRVSPCPGSCYPAALLEGPIADELRPYAGTTTAFQFFGTVSCGGVEGCALSVDHWDLSSCVTPTATRSWGRLKTIYR